MRSLEATSVACLGAALAGGGEPHKSARGFHLPDGDPVQGQATFVEFPAGARRGLPAGPGRPVRSAFLATFLGVALAAGGESPRLAAAPVSVPGPSVIGGGIAAVEATVRSGSVASVRQLLGDSPFLDLLATDVSGWRYGADRDETRVLVVGVYRPPELLPSSPLEPGSARDHGADALPHPVHVEVPAYPAGALGAGVVVLEVEVDAAGAVSAIRTVHAGAGFERAAREAAREWRFRPGRVDGRPTASPAVLVFVLREPVVLPPPRA